MEGLKKKDLLSYIDLLPHCDQEEIRKRNFCHIYYIALGLYTLPPLDEEPTVFDSVDGFYKVSVRDHIHFRYEVICPLGKGSYGEVFLVFDHKTKWRVALKILRNIKYLPTNFKDEMATLEILNKHCPNALKMHDHFIFRNHPCIVLELLDLSLYDSLVHRLGKSYTIQEVKKIIKSLLCNLLELKKVNMVHCDLKPDNVAFVRKGEFEVKIIDFGCSVILKEKFVACFQARQYRAPEIFLRIPFGFPVDMWCVGVIAAELFTGSYLFPAARDIIQLSYMAQVIGVPSKKILGESEVARQYFHLDGYPKYLTRNLRQRLNPQENFFIGAPSSLDLSIILSDSGSEEYIDFVRKCLTWDPDDRLTVEQALKHPWIMEDTNEEVMTALSMNMQNLSIKDTTSEETNEI